MLSATAPSAPPPLPEQQLCPLPPTPSRLRRVSPRFPPGPLSRVRPVPRPCAQGARPEGNSHCLQDSWGPPPGSPRAPQPSPAGCRGCSPSRPASGAATAVTTTASSRLMPRGSSSQPEARGLLGSAAGCLGTPGVAGYHSDCGSSRPQALSASFSQAPGVPRAQGGAELRELRLPSDQNSQISRLFLTPASQE